MDLPSLLSSSTLPPTHSHRQHTESHFQLLNFSPKWLWRPTEASQRTALFSGHEFRVHTRLSLHPKNNKASARGGAIIPKETHRLPRAQRLQSTARLCVWLPAHVPPTPQFSALM